MFPASCTLSQVNGSLGFCFSSDSFFCSSAFSPTASSSTFVSWENETLRSAVRMKFSKTSSAWEAPKGETTVERKAVALRLCRPAWPQTILSNMISKQRQILESDVEPMENLEIWVLHFLTSIDGHTQQALAEIKGCHRGKEAWHTCPTWRTREASIPQFHPRKSKAAI